MGVRDIRGVRGRRGLLAGAAALVAGGLARLAGPGRAEAGHTGLATPEPLHIGVINDGTGASDTETQTAIAARTVLLATGGGVFRARNLTVAGTNNSNALEGVANAFGVIGRQTGTILNHSTFGLAAGVAGVSESSGTGVVGRSTTGVGVRGLSNEGRGVLGMALTNGIDATSGPSGKVGVIGFSDSGIGVQGSSTTNEGVHGNSDSGIGVVGLSTSAYGVYGFSTNTNGVVGQSGGSGAALVGFTVNGIGVFGGVTGGGAGVAGYFDGPVFVKSLTVAGGAKSASVKDKHGVDRRMYCQESPEPWFEDFGTGQLAGGRATIRLDQDFAQVVKTDDYSVFPIAEGDCKGLYIASKTPTSFEVRELQGGTSSVPFCYRVVARRADPVGGRMEKVTVPDIARLKGAPAPPKRPGSAPAPSTAPAPAEPGRR